MAVRRTYDQYCGLAHALDVIGERWTLLIVRELMSGPKRYSDLAEGLAGIGTSLLATRLRQLEAEGVLRRRLLEPPTVHVAYELTGIGRELGRAIVPLALWGARHFIDAPRSADESFRAEWWLVFVADSLNLRQSPARSAVYEFHVDDSVARLRIRDAHADVLSGPADPPADAVLRSDSATVAAIIGQRTTIADAVTAGSIQAEGDSGAVTYLLELLETQLRTLSPFDQAGTDG
ncbi:putative transcriptional regulator [Nocardia nova SH22a]|uniref:Putative transcriptional regulator n=1 Tax=Nocardia nova SH22a TaxID=1415166 RepID=W5TFI8_9NOCA|nr:winged helix-turn-helix transcriptional regulator [Nocardia nova]AHH17894.1 putative transcriptional regulator [Nocardia nova SH22a]